MINSNNILETQAVHFTVGTIFLANWQCRKFSIVQN